jgi:polyvinyl alcohol dehydrogenase (cytochrome)
MNNNKKIFLIVLYLLVPSALAAPNVTNILQPKLPNCGNFQSNQFEINNSPSWNNWGNGIENARYQPLSSGKISVGDLKKLRIKWSYGFTGSEKVDAQPTVAGGRIFSSGGTNTIHAIDLSTGCRIWQTKAKARIKTAVITGEINKKTYLFFGDQIGNAYALDALTGKEIWVEKIHPHKFAQISGSPIFYNSVVYFPTSSGWEEGAAANPSYECCTFRGSITALNASDGSTVWKTYTIKESAIKTGPSRYGPSGAGIWSSPTLDIEKGRLYVTTGNNFSLPATETSDAIIAISIIDGTILWTQQITAKDVTNNSCYESIKNNCPISNAPDFDFASPVILTTIEGNKRILLAGQKSGMVTAIDPDDNGKILWQTRIGYGSPLGGIQHGMASDGKYLYAAISYVQISKSSSSIRGSQPGFDGWYLLGSRGGGIHAVDIQTGKIKWSQAHPGCGQTPGCSQAQSAAITVTDGYVLSGGLDGILRSYSTLDGSILWEVDTKVTLKGSNGADVKGGSLDGAGPVITSGIMLVNSGYRMFGGIPGNALLAFDLSGDN